jgi:Flp pilus assembly protein TadD
MSSNDRLKLLQRLIRPCIFAIAVTLGLGGCAANRDDMTGSISATRTADSDVRRRVEAYGEQYKSNPNNPEIAVAYAQALRATGQHAQAVAVLQQASIRSPQNTAVLGAYGRALADNGEFAQALEVLRKAHRPDQPDWRILNAQGTVLDQMGSNAEARRYYETALKIAPNEPAILSNLGLSYALSRDLPQAEATLRRASQLAGAEPKVRQNLALVLGLQGKFAEAERVAAGDLPPDEAKANIAQLREIIGQENPWKKLGQNKAPANG